MQNDQKDGRKKPEMFREDPLEWSNGSEAPGEEHPFVESNEKTFPVDPVFNKQNDWLVKFGNAVSLSTTKHPALMMMAGVVASNGEKMPPVWFERGCRLNSDIYEEASRGSSMD